MEPVGLFPCPSQLPKVDDFGEIEQRSSHRRHRNAAVFGPVVLVKAATMQSDAVPPWPELTARATCHVYSSTALLSQAPQSRCASMAEQSPVAARKHRSEPAAALVDTAMPNRKCLPVKWVKAASPEPPPHRALPNPELLQLSPPDHSVLPIRKPGQRHPLRLTLPARALAPAIPTMACPSFPCHMDP